MADNDRFEQMCWEGFCKSQHQAVPSRLQQSVHGCIAQRLQEWGRSRGLSVSRRGANDGAEIEIVIETETEVEKE